MNNIDTTFLRDIKAQCYRKTWDNYTDRSSELRLNVLENVVLEAFGQLDSGQISDGYIVDDCDYCAAIINSGDRGIAGHISGRTLYAGYLRRSWGHFLMNSTARLWPAFNGDINAFENIVFFGEDRNHISLDGNFKEFFALAGILDKVKILPPAVYSFDSLTIGEISIEIGVHVSSQFLLPFGKVIETVTSAQGSQNNLYTRPLLLARSSWSHNSDLQININSIEMLLAENGFDVVSPESLCLSQLILAMHRAPVVASFSGSTAHNFLFCPWKRKIILERCAANNIYQIGIAKLQNDPLALVDCFWQPLLSSSTDNSTIYGITPQMSRFISQNNWNIPDCVTQSVKSPLAEFRRHLNTYHRQYGYSLGLNQWETSQLPAIAEAYFDSFRRYRKFILRRYPVRWSDFLSIRVYLRMLKDFLRR